MVDSKEKICTSCGKSTAQYVEFKCPSCLDNKIARCYSCREKHIRYRCSKCNTEGP